MARELAGSPATRRQGARTVSTASAEMGSKGSDDVDHFVTAVVEDRRSEHALVRDL
jgi:hypothetical protein